MKSMMKMMVWVAMVAGSFMADGQTKIDDRKMEQDLAVAENILNTLIRQNLTSNRGYYPVDVRGNYTAGYGVTLRLPRTGMYNVMTINSSVAGYSYSYSDGQGDVKTVRVAPEREVQGIKERTTADQARATGKAKLSTTSKNQERDSLMESYDALFLKVAKDFLADYGDLISQLKPEERIIVSNRTDDYEGAFYLKWDGDSRRSLISAEAKKDDIIQLKQGKISRDQFMSRLKIVNTESTGELDPDLEVLSSMFNRLYREDLSKTFYSQGNISYERLKDFGAIFYMRVYSSTEEQQNKFYMPTVGMRDVSQQERDKKVKELYPQFENELKDNLIEYARAKSLGDEEQITFKVKLTKCVGCGIPETLELSVKNSVLKDYNAGKISKESAVAKVLVKKSGAQ